jgi:hypothetical protein
MSRAPFGLAWPAVAGVATGIALAASHNLSVAVPAAALAVVAGGLALVAALRPEPSRDDRPTFPSRISPVREMFSSGPLGREDLVLLLDRIERTLSRPDLPPRPAQQIEALLSLPPAEFRRYLAARLAIIEGSS